MNNAQFEELKQIMTVGKIPMDNNSKSINALLDQLMKVVFVFIVMVVGWLFNTVLDLRERQSVADSERKAAAIRNDEKLEYIVSNQKGISNDVQSILRTRFTPDNIIPVVNRVTDLEKEDDLQWSEINDNKNVLRGVEVNLQKIQTKLDFIIDVYNKQYGKIIK